jgi:lysophospholipase L1-like esterase
MILYDGSSWAWGDTLKDRENDRYSSLVGGEHVNISECGKSNDGILRTTIEYCENNPVDIAVIQLTKISRREILQDLNSLYRILPKKNSDICNAYYRYLHNPYDDLANFYKNKFLLENYFESKQIKYLLMSLMRPKDSKGILKKSSWEKMSKKEIMSLYQLFGGTKRDNLPYFDEHQKNDGHPNEKGHQKIADYVLQNL